MLLDCRGRTTQVASSLTISMLRCTGYLADDALHVRPGIIGQGVDYDATGLHVAGYGYGIYQA